MAAYVEASAALPAQPPWIAARRAVRLGHVAKMEAAALALALRGAAASDLPPRGELASLSGVPTLILAWEGDPGHPVSTAMALHDLIDGSTLVVASSEADVATWPAVVARFVAARRPAP